jgi:hypothetical protein
MTDATAQQSIGPTTVGQTRDSYTYSIIIIIIMMLDSAYWNIDDDEIVYTV